MIEVKTAELIGPALDWAVCRAAGWIAARVVAVETPSKRYYEIHSPSGLELNPSASWARGGPLVEKYQVALTPEAHDGAEGTEMSERWSADVYYAGGERFTTEPCETALIAACRAIVVVEIGETVEVPAELAQGGAQ